MEALPARAHSTGGANIADSARLAVFANLLSGLSEAERQEVTASLHQVDRAANHPDDLSRRRDAHACVAFARSIVRPDCLGIKGAGTRRDPCRPQRVR